MLLGRPRCTIQNCNGRNKVPNFIYSETLEQFKILLTHPDIVQHTAKYITKNMAIRDFLISKHKNNA